jgi:hypothetical protein
MNQLITKSILRFVLLVIFQVLILNNINIGGFINPYLYVLFILLLPIQTPGWFLLLTSFFIGLSVDMFTHTPGLHAAASTFMAFLRPGILNLLLRNKEFEADTEPGIKEYGFVWFLAYSSILVFFHHLLLFYLEVFRFTEFFLTLSRVFVSSLVTLVLVILSQYLFIRHKSR